MAIQTKAVATSTSAALLVPQTTRRVGVLICNEDATNAVRIGPSTVTNAGGAAGTRGLRIAAGATLPLNNDFLEGAAGEDIYVIADAGTPTVSVLEIIP